MTWRFVAANAALSVAFVASIVPFAFSLDNSYVVQLHATREVLSLPEEGADLRTQLMSTESGQQFECLLPPLASGTGDDDELTVSLPSSLNAKYKEGKEQTVAFMSFGRAAAKKVKPKCLQYVDTPTWVYEVCIGVSIRRSKHQKSSSLLNVFLPALENEVDTALDSKINKEKDDGAEEEAEELGDFNTDSSHAVLAYDYYTVPGLQERLAKLEKPLFTQTFGTDQQIHVQFICSTLDDVIAVQWKRSTEDQKPRDIAAFLVGSRMFCNPQHSDIDESDLVSVHSLLQPLKDARTCITRNEGWWTYEFCFGRSLRQYHKNSDGRITAEYSLGTFDEAGNRDLERLGSALVSEHIDATHDVSRPAYLELYDDGTFCKEFESRAPRKAKVFYFCSQGGTSHHILAVKETQTCSYTVKVSSPVLCDHPHFLNDEQNSEQDVQILHCIPLIARIET